MKKFTTGLLAGVMLTSSITVFASSGRMIQVVDSVKRVIVNNITKPFDEDNAPFVYNGTTYVPLRFIADALGEPVDWDSNTGTVFIGQNNYKKNPVANTENNNKKNPVANTEIKLSNGVILYNLSNIENAEDYYWNTVNAVKKYLKDPYSAQFIGTASVIFTDELGYGVVGTVRATNSYGGYKTSDFMAHFGEGMKLETLSIDGELVFY